MPHPLTIPTLAVLAIAGSGLGVYIGRGAISEINPAYYSQPETRFHSDLTPYRPTASAGVVYRAGELTPAEMAQALGSGCVGCRTYPEEYFPVHDEAVEDYPAERWAEPRPSLAAYEPQPADPEAERKRSADLAMVERYSGYRPPAEQEAEAADAPAAEPIESATVELASAEAEVEEPAD